MKDILVELKRLFPEEMHKDIFCVGGMVRDSLLGNLDRSNLDVDLVARIPAEKLLELGTTPVASKSAAPVFLLRHEKFGDIQIALPRREKKIAPGNNGFEFFGDHNLPLEEDLRRRDFTVNAMAMGLDGTLFDPFDGRTALEEKEMIPVSDAFFEDPARVFRAFSFCARGFRLPESTRKAIRNHDWTLEFANLPEDRVWKEVEKALKAKEPWRFFEEMVATGVGECFFPEIFQMVGIPAGPPEHHPAGDLLFHSLDIMAQVSRLTEDPSARLAALLHDVGKIATPVELWPRHFGHDKKGAEIVPALLKRIRAPKSFITHATAVAALHMKAQRWPEMRPAKKIRLVTEAGKTSIVPLALVVAADSGQELHRLVEVGNAAFASIDELGLRKEAFNGRPGTEIQAMILTARVERVKKEAA